MSHFNPVHPRSAVHGMCGVGTGMDMDMAGLGVGGPLGLIVVDSNRPAIGAGIARALPTQFAAAP